MKDNANLSVDVARPATANAGANGYTLKQAKHLLEHSQRSAETRENRNRNRLL